MIGTAIGAGMSAIGSIYGGIKNSDSMRRIREALRRRQAENQAWYDRRYNEDATQRASAQALLQRTEDAIRKRNQIAAGQAAVGGATESAIAAAKEANNQTYADAVSRINADADARKDKIESDYRSTKSALEGQVDELNLRKAQNIAEATKGVISAAGNIASSLDDIGEKNIEEQETEK